VRLSRQVQLTERLKLIALAESFNLLNRTNGRVEISDDGFLNNAGSFILTDKRIGYTYFPGYYNSTSDFVRPTSAYAHGRCKLRCVWFFDRIRRDTTSYPG
jgi:hypothetical protein